MNKNKFKEIEHAFQYSRQEMISLIESSISPNISSRRSTLSPNALATVLAHSALRQPSEQTTQWIRTNAQGMDLIGIPTPFSQSSPLMLACFLIIEKVCGVSLPLQLKEKIPPLGDVSEQLNYPWSYDTSYTLPLHLACASLLHTVEGTRMPEILHMIYVLQQEDGSWTDDTTITALAALALQKEGIKPKYDFEKWLERERLSDGSWAVANGEVWETSYALMTGEVPQSRTLVEVLKECMHPQDWWGFSRYAVPDSDSTAVASCALAPYEPQIALTACEKLLDVQHDNGAWGAFPQIEGVVPHETVIGKPRGLSNDITCHVLEALEQHDKNESIHFRRGMSFLLETQEQDGHWKTTWWNSDIYASTEIALLMLRNGYSDSAVQAVEWLEKKQKEPLNIVECALLMTAFSEFSDYSDSLNQMIHRFLERFSYGALTPTFDSVYFVGLIDCALHRLSIVVSSLRAVLRKCYVD